MFYLNDTNVNAYNYRLLEMKILLERTMMSFLPELRLLFSWGAANNFVKCEKEEPHTVDPSIRAAFSFLDLISFRMLVREYCAASSSFSEGTALILRVKKKRTERKINVNVPRLRNKW